MRKGLLVLAGLSLLAGCGTSVKREGAGQMSDISGHWSPVDANETAQKMINDCLSRPWLTNFSNGNSGKQPVVIVGTVRNNTQEHIPTDAFVENLQSALINSGKVQFVANKEERGEVRGERADQDTNASEESRKANGQETGADFMLSGDITETVDAEGGRRNVLFSVHLKLLNMQSHIIAWNGGNDIGKAIKRSGAGW
jgi:hypothetical protein